MTSRRITVRGIFDDSGELIRFLYQNGGGKYCFMDCEPSKDASIDEFCMELMPPVVAKPEQPIEHPSDMQTTLNDSKPPGEQGPAT